MSQPSDAYNGVCPKCGCVFTLADLSRMAVGDGWERWLWVRMPNGSECPVRFGDFNPAEMRELTSVPAVLTPPSEQAEQ